MNKTAIKIFITILIITFLIPNFVFAQKSDDPFLEQWAYEDVGLYEAWNYTTGSKDVVVAVIDNGFDTNHSDLKDNVWINEDEVPDNNIDDDHNGYIDDINGWNFFKSNNEIRADIENFSEDQLENGIYSHATYVAGIIGAVGNNGIDGAGLNWDVSLMNLKVVDERGVGGLEQIEEAIFYAVNNGADIINISIVGNDVNEEENIIDAINYAYDHGVLVVAAAGNDYYDLDEFPRYPACSDKDFDVEKILGVSAMASNHRLAMFSNIGSCIDITAPGVNITSTVFVANDEEKSFDMENSLNGTSFATPFVAGAAALIKSINFDWTAGDIIDILLKTVHHTRGQDENEYNDLFGYGLLKINDAVKYAIEKKNNILKDKMFFIDRETGDYKKQINSKESSEILNNELLKNFQDIKLTKISGEDEYVLFKKTDEFYEVLFFDLDLNFIKKINLDLDGKWNFTLADVYSTSNPEIIASPNFSSEIYIKIFDIRGKYIKTYKKEEKHDAAFVEKIKNFEGKDYLSLVFKKAGETYIEELDKDFKILSEFSLENFDFNDFVITNTDSDYEEEYIFSSVVGEISKVFVVNHKEIEKDFIVFPLKYKQGFKMSLFDYDNDNRDELILTAGDKMTTRVFDFKTGLRSEWQSFAQNLYFLPTK